MSEIEKTNNDKKLSDNLDLIFENFDIKVKSYYNILMPYELDHYTLKNLR